MRFSRRRFRAILIKEYRHIFRAPRTLILVILAPAALLLLLANIFVVEADQARFALWDLDRSTYSRRYIASLTADGDFTIADRVSSYAEAEAFLRRGHGDFVLVLPVGFDEALVSGKPAIVQAIFDATDAIRTPQVNGSLVARSSAFSQDILLRGQQVSGQPIELRSTNWFNPSAKSMVGMVPGLIPIVLSMPALAFGLSLARERELGSFEGLIATPVQGTEYLLGKSSSYISLGVVAAVMTWSVAVLVFDVPFRGSFLLYLLLSALYLAATIGLVTALAPVLKSQQIAFFVVLVFFFVPSFFTTGLLTPVLDEGLSRLSSDIFPATHYMVIARGIFVKGLGCESLQRPILFLTGMYLAGNTIALLTFRKRLM
ncbi:MAG: ABC transporter permease [Anaerolineae bacterium]